LKSSILALIDFTSVTLRSQEEAQEAGGQEHDGSFEENSGIVEVTIYRLQATPSPQSFLDHGFGCA